MVQAVETRLGYDPFVAQAATQVSVEVDGLAGVVTIVRADAAPAKRAFAPAADCRSLLEAMALALAVAIDPILMTRAVAPVPVVVAEPAEPSPVVAPVAVVTPSTGAPWRLALLGATGLELGTQPAGLWAVRVGVRLSRGHFGVTAGPFLTFPSRASLSGGGSVDVTGGGGDVAACLHFWPVSACLASRVGAVRFDGRDLISAKRGWTPSAFIGPRVTLELPQSTTIGFFAAAELWFPLVRTRMLVGETAAWEQPAIAGGLLAGFAWRGS